MVAELALAEGSTVLDLGCGTGLNVPLLAEAVGPEGKVIALDYTEGMLAQARKKAKRQGLNNVVFGLMDARDLSQDRLDEVCGHAVQVDAAVATLLLSVVPDWRQVFERMWAVLRPGGVCAVLDGYPLAGPLKLFSLAENLAAAADTDRPTWDLLEEVAEDVRREMFVMKSLHVTVGRKGAGL